MYLHIDSRNRLEGDSANSFVLTLQEPIKNITRCSVYTAQFPQVTGPERFLFIDIPELRSDQMVDTSSESFNVNWFVGLVPNDGSLYKPSRPLWSVYETPIDAIYKLTIRVTDYQGVPVDLDTHEFSLVLELEKYKPSLDDDDVVEPGNIPSNKPLNPYLIIGAGIILVLFIILRGRKKS